MNTSRDRDPDRKERLYATMTYDLKWWGHGFLTFTETAIRWVYGSRPLFN